MKEGHDINQLTDHLFRREFGRMVSVLTKIFGTENLETAEDVVQQSFIDALSVWKFKGIPDNPSAWLYRVAKNKAIDVIRKNKHSVQFNFNDPNNRLLTSEYTMIPTMENLWNEHFIDDDQLSMMFVCCHPGISQENQITLILKTLCGFSTAEIAKAFLTTEDTISKRLYRTKEFFRNHKIKLAIPSSQEIEKRTDAVLNSIYLLFNEGYNSTCSEELIRKDLMEEAMMLCKLLTKNKLTRFPAVYALMALMCFHFSRNDSRLTHEGEIILLGKQDRSKWDLSLIRQGNIYMNRAAFGNSISTYHLEAAIAYEHCIAPSFDKTNWKQILSYYEWLCTLSYSPIRWLNKTIAVMQLMGAEHALKHLNEIEGEEKLRNYHLYYSLLGDIYAQLQNASKAIDHYKIAINLTPSETERRLLRDKMAQVFDT